MFCVCADKECETLAKRLLNKALGSVYKTPDSPHSSASAENSASCEARRALLLQSNFKIMTKRLPSKAQKVSFSLKGKKAPLKNSSGEPEIDIDQPAQQADTTSGDTVGSLLPSPARFSKRMGELFRPDHVGVEEMQQLIANNPMEQIMLTTLALNAAVLREVNRMPELTVGGVASNSDSGAGKVLSQMYCGQYGVTVCSGADLVSPPDRASRFLLSSDLKKVIDTTIDDHSHVTYTSTENPILNVSEVNMVSVAGCVSKDEESGGVPGATLTSIAGLYQESMPGGSLPMCDAQKPFSGSNADDISDAIRHREFVGECANLSMEDKANDVNMERGKSARMVTTDDAVPGAKHRKDKRHREESEECIISRSKQNRSSSRDRGEYYSTMKSSISSCESRRMRSGKPDRSRSRSRENDYSTLKKERNWRTAKHTDYPGSVSVSRRRSRSRSIDRSRKSRRRSSSRERIRSRSRSRDRRRREQRSSVSRHRSRSVERGKKEKKRSPAAADCRSRLVEVSVSQRTSRTKDARRASIQVQSKHTGIQQADTKADVFQSNKCDKKLSYWGKGGKFCGEGRIHGEEKIHSEISIGLKEAKSDDVSECRSDVDADQTELPGKVCHVAEDAAAVKIKLLAQCQQDDIAVGVDNKKFGDEFSDNVDRAAFALPASDAESSHLNNTCEDIIPGACIETCTGMGVSESCGDGTQKQPEESILKLPWQEDGAGSGLSTQTKVEDFTEDTSVQDIVKNIKPEFMPVVGSSNITPHKPEFSRYSLPSSRDQTTEVVGEGTTHECSQVGEIPDVMVRGKESPGSTSAVSDVKNVGPDCDAHNLFPSAGSEIGLPRACVSVINEHLNPLLNDVTCFVCDLKDIMLPGENQSHFTSSIGNTVISVCQTNVSDQEVSDMEVDESEHEFNDGGSGRASSMVESETLPVVSSLETPENSWSSKANVFVTESHAVSSTRHMDCTLSDNSTVFTKQHHERSQPTIVTMDDKKMYQLTVSSSMAVTGHLIHFSPGCGQPAKTDMKHCDHHIGKPLIWPGDDVVKCDFCTPGRTNTACAVTDTVANMERHVCIGRILPKNSAPHTDQCADMGSPKSHHRRMCVTDDKASLVSLPKNVATTVGICHRTTGDVVHDGRPSHGSGSYGTMTNAPVSENVSLTMRERIVSSEATEIEKKMVDGFALSGDTSDKSTEGFLADSEQLSSTPFNVGSREYYGHGEVSSFNSLKVDTCDEMMGATTMTRVKRNDEVFATVLTTNDLDRNLLSKSECDSESRSTLSTGNLSTNVNTKCNVLENAMPEVAASSDGSENDAAMDSSLKINQEMDEHCISKPKPGRFNFISVPLWELDENERSGPVSTKSHQDAVSLGVDAVRQGQRSFATNLGLDYGSSSDDNDDGERKTDVGATSASVVSLKWDNGRGSERRKVAHKTRPDSKTESSYDTHVDNRKLNKDKGSRSSRKKHESTSKRGTNRSKKVDVHKDVNSGYVERKRDLLSTRHSAVHVDEEVDGKCHFDRNPKSRESILSSNSQLNQDRVSEKSDLIYAERLECWNDDIVVTSGRECSISKVKDGDVVWNKRSGDGREGGSPSVKNSERNVSGCKMRSTSKKRHSDDIGKKSLQANRDYKLKSSSHSMHKGSDINDKNVSLPRGDKSRNERSLSLEMERQKRSVSRSSIDSNDSSEAHGRSSRGGDSYRICSGVKNTKHSTVRSEDGDPLSSTLDRNGSKLITAEHIIKETTSKCDKMDTSTAELASSRPEHDHQMFGYSYGMTIAKHAGVLDALENYSSDFGHHNSHRASTEISAQKASDANVTLDLESPAKVKLEGKCPSDWKESPHDYHLSARCHMPVHSPRNDEGIHSTRQSTSDYEWVVANEIEEHSHSGGSKGVLHSSNGTVWKVLSESGNIIIKRKQTSSESTFSSQSTSTNSDSNSSTSSSESSSESNSSSSSSSSSESDSSSDASSSSESTNVQSSIESDHDDSGSDEMEWTQSAPAEDGGAGVSNTCLQYQSRQLCSMALASDISNKVGDMSDYVLGSDDVSVKGQTFIVDAELKPSSKRYKCSGNMLSVSGAVSDVSEIRKRVARKISSRDGVEKGEKSETFSGCGTVCDSRDSAIESCVYDTCTRGKCILTSCETFADNKSRHLTPVVDDDMRLDCRSSFDGGKSYVGVPYCGILNKASGDTTCMYAAETDSVVTDKCYQRPELSAYQWTSCPIETNDCDAVSCGKLASNRHILSMDLCSPFTVNSGDDGGDENVSGCDDSSVTLPSDGNIATTFSKSRSAVANMSYIKASEVVTCMEGSAVSNLPESIHFPNLTAASFDNLGTMMMTNAGDAVLSNLSHHVNAVCNIETKPSFAPGVISSVTPSNSAISGGIFCHRWKTPDVIEQCKGTQIGSREFDRGWKELVMAERDMTIAPSCSVYNDAMFPLMQDDFLALCYPVSAADGIPDVSSSCMGDSVTSHSSVSLPVMYSPSAISMESDAEDGEVICQHPISKDNSELQSLFRNGCSDADLAKLPKFPDGTSNVVSSAALKSSMDTDMMVLSGKQEDIPVSLENGCTPLSCQKSGQSSMADITVTSSGHIVTSQSSVIHSDKMEMLTDHGDTVASITEAFPHTMSSRFETGSSAGGCRRLGVRPPVETVIGVKMRTHTTSTTLTASSSSSSCVLCLPHSQATDSTTKSQAVIVTESPPEDIFSVGNVAGHVSDPLLSPTDAPSLPTNTNTSSKVKIKMVLGRRLTQLMDSPLIEASIDNAEDRRQNSTAVEMLREAMQSAVRADSIHGDPSHGLPADSNLQSMLQNQSFSAKKDNFTMSHEPDLLEDGLQNNILAMPTTGPAEECQLAEAIIALPATTPLASLISTKAESTEAVRQQDGDAATVKFDNCKEVSAESSAFSDKFKNSVNVQTESTPMRRRESDWIYPRHSDGMRRERQDSTERSHRQYDRYEGYGYGRKAENRRLYSQEAVRRRRSEDFRRRDIHDDRRCADRQRNRERDQYREREHIRRKDRENEGERVHHSECEKNGRYEHEKFSPCVHQRHHRHSSSPRMNRHRDSARCIDYRERQAYVKRGKTREHSVDAPTHSPCRQKCINDKTLSYHNDNELCKDSEKLYENKSSDENDKYMDSSVVVEEVKLHVEDGMQGQVGDIPAAEQVCSTKGSPSDVMNQNPPPISPNHTCDQVPLPSALIETCHGNDVKMLPTGYEMHLASSDDVKMLPTGHEMHLASSDDVKMLPTGYEMHLASSDDVKMLPTGYEMHLASSDASHVTGNTSSSRYVIDESISEQPSSTDSHQFCCLESYPTHAPLISGVCFQPSNFIHSIASQTTPPTQFFSPRVGHHYPYAAPPPLLGNVSINAEGLHCTGNVWPGLSSYFSLTDTSSLHSSQRYQPFDYQNSGQGSVPNISGTPHHPAQGLLQLPHEKRIHPSPQHRPGVLRFGHGGHYPQPVPFAEYNLHHPPPPFSRPALLPTPQIGSQALHQNCQEAPVDSIIEMKDNIGVGYNRHPNETASFGDSPVCRQPQSLGKEKRTDLVNDTFHNYVTFTNKESEIQHHKYLSDANSDIPSIENHESVSSFDALAMETEDGAISPSFFLSGSNASVPVVETNGQRSWFKSSGESVCDLVSPVLEADMPKTRTAFNGDLSSNTSAASEMPHRQKALFSQSVVSVCDTAAVAEEAEVKICISQDLSVCHNNSSNRDGENVVSSTSMAETAEQSSSELATGDGYLHHPTLTPMPRWQSRGEEDTCGYATSHSSSNTCRKDDNDLPLNQNCGVDFETAFDTPSLCMKMGYDDVKQGDYKTDLQEESANLAKPVMEEVVCDEFPKFEVISDNIHLKQRSVQSFGVLFTSTYM